MKNFNYPTKSAYKLATQMKHFRARTEEIAYSEINNNAENDRKEVVRQIDWTAFNEVIAQLEFCYNQQKKY